MPRGDHTSAKSAAIDPTAVVPENDPADVLTSVPLFSGLSDDEVDRIASLFKARRFAPGDVVIREGSGGASFYVIDSGEASVTIRGDEVAVLGPGDHFGEIALIDGGERLGHGDRHDRPRLPRPHVLGVPAARPGERHARLEAPPDDGADVRAAEETPA